DVTSHADENDLLSVGRPAGLCPGERTLRVIDDSRFAGSVCIHDPQSAGDVDDLAAVGREVWRRVTLTVIRQVGPSGTVYIDRLDGGHTHPDLDEDNLRPVRRPARVSKRVVSRGDLHNTGAVAVHDVD